MQRKKKKKKRKANNCRILSGRSAHLQFILQRSQTSMITSPPLRQTVQVVPDLDGFIDVPEIMERMSRSALSPIAMPLLHFSP